MALHLKEYKVGTLTPAVLSVVSSSLTRISKTFGRQAVVKMLVGPQTGRVYRKGSGEGFRRFHRASARGQRPAVDTGVLINSIEDQKISQVSHAVFVNDHKAPYGKWLQSPLFDRPILTEQDGKEFTESPEYKAEMIKILKSMGVENPVI